VPLREPAASLAGALVPGPTKEGGHLVLYSALEHQPGSQPPQLGQLLRAGGQLPVQQLLDLRL